MIQDWINPKHLTNNAIETYCNALRDPSLLVINIPDFLVPDRASSLSSFLEYDANWLPPRRNFFDKMDVSKEEWDGAPPEDRLSSICNINPAEIGQSGKNLDMFLALLDVFRHDKSICSWFSSVSNVGLKPRANLSAKAMGLGDYLGPHNDRSGNRRIAFVIYLSKNWKEEFGGGLMYSVNSKKPSRLNCYYNSITIFDVTSDQMHWIEPVTEAAAGRRRISIGGWFHDA